MRKIVVIEACKDCPHCVDRDEWCDELNEWIGFDEGIPVECPLENDEPIVSGYCNE